MPSGARGNECNEEVAKPEGNAQSGVKENGDNANIDHIAEFRRIFTSEYSEKVDYDEFKKLTETVTEGARQPLSDEEMQKLFHICDGNQDNALDKKELQDMYEWFRPIVDPKRALIIVDVQNDFINGSLALKDCPAKQDGAEVVPVINNLIDKMKFHMIAYSMDYHPKDHISFIENVHLWPLDNSSRIQDPNKVKIGDVVTYDTRFGPVQQKIWPTHCVQETYGCKFHKDLKMVNDMIIVKKGDKKDVESYTAFGAPEYGAPTILKEELERHNITEMYITGLAEDVCVGNTGLDALSFGYAVCMVKDAQRGVAEDTIDKMKEDVEEAGGRYVSSNEVMKGKGITLDDRLATIHRKLARVTLAEQTN